MRNSLIDELMAMRAVIIALSSLLAMRAAIIIKLLIIHLINPNIQIRLNGLP